MFTILKIKIILLFFVSCNFVFSQKIYSVDEIKKTEGIQLFVLYESVSCKDCVLEISNFFQKKKYDYQIVFTGKDAADIRSKYQFIYRLTGVTNISYVNDTVFFRDNINDGIFPVVLIYKNGNFCHEIKYKNLYKENLKLNKKLIKKTIRSF
jgi:hypothetical protein